MVNKSKIRLQNAHKIVNQICGLAPSFEGAGRNISGVFLRAFACKQRANSAHRFSEKPASITTPHTTDSASPKI